MFGSGRRQQEQLNARGTELRRLHGVTGDRAALDEAVELLRAAADHEAADASQRAGALTNLGNALSDRYQFYGASADLDRALEAHREALAAVPEGHPFAANIQQNLGVVLEYAYRRDGRVADMAAAVEAHERAVALTTRESETAGRLNSLGLAVLELYEITGTPGDLDRAVEALETAFEMASSQPEAMPPGLVRANLGLALNTRYDREGDLSDLEGALQGFQAAVLELPPDSPLLPLQLANLASGLSERYARLHAREDLDAAIDLARRAVDLTPAGAAQRPLRLMTLGNALHDRGVSAESRADLDEAANSLRAAIEELPTGAPLKAQVSTNLANMLRFLHVRYDDAAALDQAIELYRQAAAAHGEAAPEQPLVLANLGVALSERYGRSRSEPDRQEAVAAFRRSCRQGLETDPASALRAGRLWAQTAAAQAAWDEAAEASAAALTAMRRLFAAQVGRSHREASLRGAFGVADLAAYALARVGDLRGAAVALEQGRALMLSDGLERDAAEVDELAAQGHAELRDRYLEAAARVRRIERSGTAAGGRDWGEADAVAPALGSTAEPPAPEDVRAARVALDAVVGEIRKVPGFERFLAGAALEDIAVLAREVPAVYVVSTTAGGLALVLTPDGEVAARWLPGLIDATLREQLHGYFRAYFEREQQPHEWRDALDRITRWLWESVMADVLDASAFPPRIVLVPTGWLGLAPLHAAWTEGAADDSRRYVLDETCVTYAPNLRALDSESESDEAAFGVLVVEDPQPVSADQLRFASPEAEGTCAAFPACDRLTGREATRERVLAKLGDHSVLHFACHGYTSAQPLDSALLMAGDEPLTVRDIFQIRLADARLAVLSACESAMIGTELPDEVVGLPAALLQAGVPGVIGSLWSVPDISTMLLMTRFYRLWRADGLDPAVALQHAQRWIRTATGEERLASLSEAGVELPEAVAAALRQDPELFAHPYHWAAFAYVGA